MELYEKLDESRIAVLRHFRPKTGKKKKSSKATTSKSTNNKPKTTPILRLPAEIILLVVELLNQKERASFCRANRSLHCIVNPVIYANNVKLQDASCLPWAAQLGRLGTLKHALEAGADLNKIVSVKATKDLTGIAIASDNPAVNDFLAEDTAALSQLEPYGTVLHLACRAGHKEVVEWLIDNGADMDSKSFRLCNCMVMKSNRHSLRRITDYPAWHPLHLALCHQERSVAELLIHRGASSKLEFRSDQTALHSAAANGLVPIIKLLALEDINLDINERDTYDNTALHHIAHLWEARDAPEIRDTVTKLLALGANLEALNQSRYTPLLNACYRGNFAVALRLVSVGANPEPPNYSNPRDCRPLYYCMLPRAEFFDLDDAPVKHDQFEGNRVALIKALVEAGVDVNARFDKRGHRGLTALMLACELAEPRVVAVLLQGGASVNCQDRNGRTPLFYACSVRVDHRSEVPEIAKLLLRKGARIDLEHENDSTTLDWAMNKSKWAENNILSVMLEVSDKVNLTEAKLKSALQKCASTGNHNALKLLLKFADRTYGVTDDDISQYINLIIAQIDQWGQRPTLETLLESGRVVDSNETLLLKTMMQKNRDLSLAVLGHGVNVSGSRFYGGQTFLHLACQWGDNEVVKALLERAAEVNVFDDELRTPLSIAVTESDFETAEILMKEVADPYLTPDNALLQRLYPDDGEWMFVKRRYLTAFDLAIRDDRGDIVEEMLSRFALPEIPPGTKFSYLHRACQNPNIAILQLLLRKGANPYVGKESNNMPPVMMLKHLWTQPTMVDLAPSSLDMVKAFMNHMDSVTAFGDILEEICTYDGPDGIKRKLKDLVMRELNVYVVFTPSRPSVGDRVPHVLLLEREDGNLAEAWTWE